MVVRFKTVAICVLAVVSVCWLFNAKDFFSDNCKLKSTQILPKFSTLQLPHAMPTPKCEPSTIKPMTFHNLASLVDTLSNEVKLIYLFPIETRRKVSFTILENEVPLLFTGKLNDKLINSHCKVDRVTTTDPRLLHKLKRLSVKQQLTSHIVINCDGILIVLTVLMPRYDYYWTAQFSSTEYAEFQQPSRAFDKGFVDNLKQFKQDKRLWVPQNDSLWSWHFQYSQFIECDYENIVWPFRRLFGSFIESHNETLIYQLLTSIRKLSLAHRVPLQIFGGTLLGWYRQCDFIPYSHDVDVIANETYYTYRLFKDIWNGGDFKMSLRYGKPNDSFELVTHHKTGWQTDFFTWHYEPGVDNETYYNYYYSGSMKANRFTYPVISELCTAELLGALVLVPCNPEQSLKTDYKEEWFQPKRSYVPPGAVFHKKYTIEEWKVLYHHYSNHSCTQPSIMNGCD